MPLVTTPTIALLGNPNTGKTTLFNALAGMRQRVGNYPGVTVETKKGQFRHGEQTIGVIDLPGTYSLAPRSPDEMVAVDVILGNQRNEPRPDVVVTIVDASNLERNLYLTTQAFELGVPVVVALNMMDVAEAKSVMIDVKRLSQNLGVPVVAMQANKGKGLAELKQAIADALEQGAPTNAPVFPDAFEHEIADLGEYLGPETSPFLLRRVLLDAGGYTERRLTDRHGTELAERLSAARRRLAETSCSIPAIEARTRYGWIREALHDCIMRPEKPTVTTSDRIDAILTDKILGTGIFLALMFVVFQSIFSWAAPLSGWIEEGQGWLEELVTANMAVGPLRSLLVKGVIGGVGGVLVFVPQIMILFAFIAFLEDCGYMARAAFLMDKLMARCGLSGKSFIPMLSSFACAIPGIMAARVIEDRRDRFATIMVAPLMSCSARLPVYGLLIAAFLSVKQGYSWWVPGLVMFFMYLLGLVVAPLVAFALKRTILRGDTPIFIMEMPSYKWPSLHTVLRRMLEAGWMFIRRAGTIILASMIIVWALLYFSVGERSGPSYDQEINELKDKIAGESEELSSLSEQTETPEVKKRKAQLTAIIEPVKGKIATLQNEWSSNSLLGRAGKAIEPIVRPLGWDWRVGMAALASFPAREVFVGSMGIIYNRGEGEADDEDYQRDIGQSLRDQAWDDDAGRKVFSVPVALSVMVFFALCCQCASTLAVIKRETNSWRWPIFTFVYMTVLAYAGALVVYQIGRLFT